MRNKIIQLLKKNNLTNCSQVNSLLVSVFYHKNNVYSINNYFICDLISMGFDNKELLIKEIISMLNQQNTEFDLELLIELFEYVISPGEKIVNGAVYTPKNIRSYIIETTLKSETSSFTTEYKMADLACGSGAFLLDLTKKYKSLTNFSYAEIFENNIYGIDIDPHAIERTKIILSLLAITSGEDNNFKFNLIVGNSISFKWTDVIDSFSGFNLIVGNPPYVASKNMSIETKLQLSNLKTCSVGNPDLYIPFFEVGIESLISDGQLGIITMNTFFKSLNGRNLRKYFSDKSLDFKIIDFGADKVFKKRNVYTCICIIKNNFNDNVSYIKIPVSGLSEYLSFSSIPYKQLDIYNGWNLFSNALIKRIEQIGIPLGKKYKTSHGIATLKNSIYIFKPINEDKKYYYLETKSGETYKIEKKMCLDVINSNKLSRKSSIENLKEKLIFPYTNESNPKVLDEVFFQDNYPKAYKYLVDHKKILSLRDKGKGQYKTWYSFGRSQGLEQVKNKMFFPKYSDRIPHYLIHADEKIYFYNGQAFLSNSVRELEILKKILQTRLFWFYISSTSKPYSSSYYSLNGNYIKNFGICELTKDEEEFVLSEDKQSVLDDFFEKKYRITLSEKILLTP